MTALREVIDWLRDIPDAPAITRGSLITLSAG